MRVATVVKLIETIFYERHANPEQLLLATYAPHRNCPAPPYIESKKQVSRIKLKAEHLAIGCWIKYKELG